MQLKFIKCSMKLLRIKKLNKKDCYKRYSKLER